MKIKLSVIFILYSLTILSQNFYEFKWTSSEVKYTGFLIYNNASDIVIRVGYTSNKVYKVAEYNCKREEYLNSKNKKVIQYNGENAKVLYPKNSSYGYYADNFYFINIDKDNHYEKLYVNDDQENSTYKTEVTYKKLNPTTDFTGSYLNQFYNTGEPFYKKFVIGGNKPLVVKNITDVVSKIRFIAIGDTNDSEIGSAVENDIRSYKKFLRTAAKNLNIGFTENIFIGDNFTKNGAINKVNNLNIGSKEVVFFLYRGHGFRWADQVSRYPRMRLGDEFNQQSYNIEDLYRKLKYKNPRLLIAIGDLCNTNSGFTPSNTTYATVFGQDISLELDLSRIKALLLKRGSILSVSAKPGQSSYANSDFGFYSKSFLDALKTEISKTKSNRSNWSIIFKTASRNASKMSTSQRSTFIQTALTKNNINN